jgi:hypothetical protein
MANESVGTYWWTYCGNKGKTAHLLAHDTRDSAEFHYSMARSMGGDFNVIGSTIKAITEAEARAALAGKFSSIEVVNPVKALQRGEPGA